MRRLFFIAAAVLGGCINIDTTHHHYPCDGGGAACPGGWVCGLDSFCHDPDAGAAYLCVSDTDCAPGWHCGVNLDGGLAACHPANAPAAYSCTLGGDGGHYPVQCEGWICSKVDQTCHDPDAGNYPCQTDDDCAFPNRCGLGVCVNVARDGLDPNAPQVALDAGVLSSPLLPGPPDLFELSYPYLATTSQGGGGAQFAQDFARVQGSTFQVIVSRPQAVALLINGQNTGQQVYAPAIAIPAPARPTAVALVGPSVLWSDGAAFYRFDIDAGEAPLTGDFSPLGLPTTFVPAHFRVSPSGETFAFNDSSWAWSGASANFSGLNTVPYKIVDMVDLGGLQDPALIATDHGLYVATPAGNSVWTPFQLQALYDGGSWVIANSDCGPGIQGVALQVQRLIPGQVVQPTQSTNFLVQGTLPDGTLVIAQADLNNGSCTPSQMNVPCAPCPDPADRLVTALGTIDTPGGQLGNTPVSRCRHPTGDGGAVELLYEIHPPQTGRADQNQCQLRYPERGGLARVEADLSVSQTSTPALGGFGGYHGQIWSTPYTLDAGAAAASPIWQLQPLLLDRAPDAIVEVTLDAGVAQLTVAEANVGSQAWSLEAAGYVQGSFSGGGTEILGLVDGERAWGMVDFAGNPTQVFDSRVFLSGNFPPILATFDPTREGGLPVHAAVAQTADGGNMLLASQFDIFMTGDVTAFAPGGAVPLPYPIPVALQIQLIPQPQLPIVALAAVNPPRQGLAEAYLLTPLEIVHAYATSPTRWTAEVLPPPADPTPWISIWTDGDRARIGFASGTVYSLPTRVPLTPAPGGLPIPDGSAVSSYVQICRSTFALAGPSIYLLKPQTGQPLGAWTSIADTAGPSSLSGGALFWGADSLAAFSPYGQAVHFPLTSGCP